MTCEIIVVLYSSSFTFNRKIIINNSPDQNLEITDILTFVLINAFGICNELIGTIKSALGFYVCINYLII